MIYDLYDQHYSKNSNTTVKYYKKNVVLNVKESSKIKSEE